MKKSFAFGMLLASSLLVACGGGTSTTSSNTASSSTPAATTSESKSSSAEATSSKEAVTVSYEITASYDELYDMFAAFEFYGLLYSDGTGVLYSAMIQNSTAGEAKRNVPQVGEPTSFKYKVTNDDDIETLEAAIDGKKFTGYKNKDGDFVLQSYSFPFAGGYSRSVDLIVSENIEFGSEEKWEKAVKEEYKDRTITVTVKDAYKGPVLYADGDKKGEPFVINFGASGSFNAEAKFELNSDFTLKASYGVGGYGGASFEGTWTVNENQIHILTIGETELVGEKDGEHEKFVWNFSHQAKDAEGNPTGDPINLTATLAWFDINAAK